ncbi:Pre-rRNA-processing protein TSR2-domain-containing protein [Pyronema omphalodes]|nr:Pre-rRNA-processing protein TSR2-domain-containing protein [Pyronema omphalodes]
MPTPAPAQFTPPQTQHWELGVSLLLNFWPPLRDAVSCNWGGPDSADKRDWLCGVIADLWDEDPEADEETVELRLLQVMEDEFEVRLEDGSAFELGKQILSLRSQIAENNFTTVEALHQRFLARSGNSSAPVVQDVDQDADSDDEEEEDEDMADAGAPELVQTPRERVEKVVDEDGFELVQKQRRR